MGKTRLAAEIEAAARADGALAAWGSGIEDAGAYAPWVAVLQSLLPHAGDLPATVLEDVRRLTGETGAAVEPVSGQDDRTRMFDAVAAMLGRAAEPAGLVVVLDDLHWADRSSLELLRHVARAAGAARLLLVLAYRESEPEPGHPLPGLLEELARARGFERVRLGGLGLEEVRRFVPDDARLGDTFVRDLHERTGGNPFFVAELARSVTEQTGAGAAATAVPESVREVVLLRLRPLPDATRRALDAAAVLGRPFSVVTLARIAGVPREEARAALEPARLARLVTEVPEAPGRLAFAHAIVRDAVQHALPPGRRGPLHAAVVELLRAGAQRGSEVPVAEVAHHALVAAREGEDPQAAYELSLDAAHEAGAVLAHAEAAGHYADALEALDELGAEAEPDAAHGGARGPGRRDGRGRGDRHWRACTTAAPPPTPGGAGTPPGSPARRWASPSSTATARSTTRRSRCSSRRSTRSRTPIAPSARASRHGSPCAWTRRPAASAARRCVEEATAMARRLGGDEALTAALYAAVLVNWRPQRSAARAAAADEILSLAPRSRQHIAMVWARMARFVDALEAGRAAAAQPELTGLAALERESRRPYVEWCLVLLRSTWATFAGRLAEGERLSEQAVELARAGAEDVDQEYAVQRLVHAKLRWRPDESGRAALSTYAVRYSGLPVWTAMLAAVDWDLGRADDARQAIDGIGRDGFAWLAATPDGLEGCALIAEAVAGLGRRADAERLYGLLAPLADRNAVIDHGWAATGPFARALAHLAAALGPPGRGARALPRRGRAEPDLGRAGLGAARARRLDRRGPRGRGARRRARPRPGAGEGVGAALDRRPPRRRGARSEDDAVGLVAPAVQPLRGGDDVARVAPAGAPGVADEEAAGVVADQGAGVQERLLARPEPLERRRAGDEAAIGLDGQQDGSVLVDPLAPLGSRSTGLTSSRLW